MLTPAIEYAPAEQREEHTNRWHVPVLAGAMACAGLGFVALALWANRVPYSAIDLTITRHVQDWPARWTTALLNPLNVLGFPPLVGIVYGSIIVLILAAGARRDAAAAAFATLGAAGLNFAFKVLVARPRPPMDLIHVARQHLPGTSFPAGHVLNFTAFAGFLCYLIWTRLAPSWQRTALMMCLIVMIALMGIARIDSGEHWPSDVLGGYLLGALWWATTILFHRWGARRSRGTRSS